MGFSVNTNVSALSAYNSLNKTQNNLQTSLARLSSGNRINNAGDDAAGLAISEGLQSQISGASVASRNAQDGISLVQTTDGALTQVQSILHRMRDLAVQGANDSNSLDQRNSIQTEADQLSDELARMENNTTFNGTSLLTDSKTLNFQVGAGSDSSADANAATNNNTITFTTVDLATALGGLDTKSAGITEGSATTGQKFDVSSNTLAQATIDAIDTAIQNVSTQQATVGATENRLNDAVSNLAVLGQNLSAANSRIMDTDMASEMVNYSQKSVLQQAGVSMLAQANASSQSILKLLG
jgi:flagellin